MSDVIGKLGFMGKEKILFITPPYHCGVVEVAGRWVPATFAYLAGAVRDIGIVPVIYDAMTKQHGLQEIEKKIIKERPAYVATTAITATTPDALEVLKIAKKVDPKIITIIGGVHSTFLPDEMLNSGHVDYVVQGEGEDTLKDLLMTLKGGARLDIVSGIAYKEGHRVVLTPTRPFIEDLDELRPAWDLIEWKDYRYFVMPGSRLGSISTSRGCSHNCTFCSQQKFWKQSWRGRKPENIVREIELLYRDFGVNVFLIPDEYPTLDKERWERILDLLIGKDLGITLLMETRAQDIVRDRDILHKYRKAGIVHIYIGLEATDQETLDLIKKDVSTDIGHEAIRLIHEHGMITETSFILGFPHETKETIKKTLELSKVYNPDFAHYLALAPWPYAEMYKELEPYVVSKDYRKYNLIDPVIKPEAMEIREIDKAIIDCYQSFYMGKMLEIMNLKDEFKKDYLLRSMKLIMSSSFIVKKLGMLGSMPPQVKELMNRLEGHSLNHGQTDMGFVQKVARSIAISAPLSRVFDFVADPSNWPRYIKRLVEIRDVSDAPLRQGSTFAWTFRIHGLNLTGSGEVTDFEEGSKIGLRMNSMFPLRKTMTFEEHHGITILKVEVGHEVPGKILNILFKLIMKTVNAMETQAVLERIRMLCEETGKEKQAGSATGR